MTALRALLALTAAGIAAAVAGAWAATTVADDQRFEEPQR